MPGLDEPIESTPGSGLRFIKDLWKNNHSSIIDDNSLPSVVGRNLSLKLNQASGHINFNSTGSGFYCVAENSHIIPDNIIIGSTVVGDHSTDFRLEITINDVLAATHFYTVGETAKTGSKSINSSEKQKILRNFDGTNNYIKLQCFGSGAPTSFKIKTVDINYSGISYNNSYSSPTPEIKSFYPKTILSSNVVNNSGINNQDGSYLSGPTNTSGTDSTFVYRTSDDFFTVSGIVFDSNSLELKFDTSGYFTQDNTTRTIDKAIFSIRYNNLSGDNTNIQSFSSVRLYSDYGNIGYGSGFHLHKTSGYSVVSTDVSFVENFNSSNKHKNTNPLNTFNVKLDDIPGDIKVSAAQIDFYLNNDNMFCMNIPGEVSYKRGEKFPSDSNTLNTGYNRLKEKNYDEILFNIAYKKLNVNETLNKNFTTPLFWKNYYEQKINTYQYSNHAYNNSLYLMPDQYLYEDFNSASDYSIYLQCSVSGNYTYLNTTNPDAIILAKYNLANQPEFILKNNAGNFFEFISYDLSNTPSVTYTPSYPNTSILITKKFDILTLYTSDGNNDLLMAGNHINLANNSNGRLYIGGSGVQDFNGYVHEYGITNKHLDFDEVNDFSYSRYRISKTLSDGSGLSLKTGNMSGNLLDRYTILFKQDFVDQPSLYQYHTPMIFAYNTLLTNPSAYSFILDYNNNTNNPSGMIISGYYNNGLFNSSESIKVGFKKTLPSGSNTVEIFPSEYSNIYGIVNTKFPDIQYLDLFFNSPNNQNHSHDFSINSFKVSFDGWYTPPTGIQFVNFTTLGGIPQSSGFDLYIANQSLSSGIDFYITGNEASNNFVNFYTNAVILQESGMSLYMIGDQSSYNIFNMSISGPVPFTDNINFFTQGTDYIPFSGNFQGFIEGTSQSGLSNTVSFNTVANFDPMSSINFYTGSSQENNNDSINFVIPCDNIIGNMFNMFIYNQHSNTDYELDFSMYSAYNMSGNLNMVI